MLFSYDALAATAGTKICLIPKCAYHHLVKDDSKYRVIVSQVISNRKYFFLTKQYL